MTRPNGISTRLGQIAIGALAALAIVAAIAGTAALAANLGTNMDGQVIAKLPKQAAPTTPGPGKSPAPQSGSNGTSKAPAPQSGGSRPFLGAVRRLVNDGTITPTEAQAVDREIQSSTFDSQTLASSGFTPSQLQAVQQALANTKRAQAAHT